MIIYNPRRCGGYIVLTSCKGSSFFKAMPLPIVATVFTLVIKWMPHIFSIPDTRAGDVAETGALLIDHPQASYALTSIVGFLLLFRSNLAYGRFWEGRTAVQNMGAAWAEASSLVVSFDSAAKGRDDYAEWKADVVHLFSLMHALAVMSLRTDADLTNLVQHVPYQDFDGVTFVTGSPWISARSSAAAGGGPASPRSRGGGSTTSILSRASSVESDDLRKGQSAPHMSPHARLRHRSISRVDLRPPRPVPKSHQTGVVSRSGLSSRAHYFPVGVHTHLKPPQVKSAASSSPRLSTDSTSVSPTDGELVRSLSASAEIRVSTTAEAAAVSTVGTGFAATDGDSVSLRLRKRSLTLGDLSAVRDACDDLRVPARSAEAESTTKVHLDLTLEQEDEPRGEDHRPRSYTTALTGPVPAQIDTTGDGEPDSTAFDTTGDGCFDAFVTNGDGKVVVDVSSKQEVSAAKADNAGIGIGHGEGNSANALPSHAHDSSSRGRGQQSTATTFAETTEPAAERNTYMEKHYLDQRLSKYNNTEATSSNSNANDFEQPQFSLMVIGGLWDSERERLAVVDPLHAERVYVVQSWIHHALVERYELEGLAVPAPLLAHIYVQISAGFSAFMQCKKLVDTPFPFPYAQIVLVCLILLSAFLPVQVCIIVNSTPLAMALTFVTVWAFCSINEVAMELEEPFMDEQNDIALADLHVDFSEKLMTLINRLTWRSSWPEGALVSSLSANGDGAYTAPRHRLSRFAAEEQALVREASNAATSVAAEGSDAAAENCSQASVENNGRTAVVSPAHRTRVNSVVAAQP